jgi:hypothetical protein
MHDMHAQCGITGIVDPGSHDVDIMRWEWYKERKREREKMGVFQSDSNTKEVIFFMRLKKWMRSFVLSTYVVIFLKYTKMIG